VLIGSVVLLSACGTDIEDVPLKMPGTEPMPIAISKPKPAPPGMLFRADVTATVDHGLGYFLQRVSVEPEVQAGKFQGFRVVDLEPPAFWQGVDLRPGDVVTEVNGMSIERDIDAYQAFISLKSAPALRVTYLRAGVPRQLTYAIVDAPAKAKSGAPDKTAPAAPKPAPAGAPTAPPSTAPAPKQSG